jgi:amidohydrolase
VRPGKEELKARACAEIARRAGDIVAISDHIMHHPESGYREVETAKFVATHLDRMGLDHRDGLALTGVKARMRGRSAGPTVAVLGELDSLIVWDHPLADPVTHAAHACGHNAQIASMLGAGMGLQTVMDHLDGDVVLFAVPAEEYIEVEWRLGLREQGKIEFLAGKAELIKLGEFDDVDMAIITHTAARPAEDGLASVGDTHNGCVVKFMRFVGKAAHAGAAPHAGINALKAAQIAMAAIDAQRETFRDDDTVRVHPIITKGGEAVSAVPADVRLETFVRGKTLEAIADAAAKVDRALRAGALGLGAGVQITTLPGYLPQRMDPNLVALTHANCAAVVGEPHMGRPRHTTGSTDVGDLGHIMPEAHPRAGGARGTIHGNDYWTVDHVLAAVNPAKFMAMTVIDLLYDGAREARRVKAEAGPKLTREEYLALVRRFASQEEFTSS